FRGGSDTEVILMAIAEWGIKKAISRCVGMFAFALWDKGERSLTICRDRLGIKPLYVGLSEGKLVFGSELKSFKEVKGFDLSIDRDSLALYFRDNCIAAPRSIFKRVQKLRPGHILKIVREDLDTNELPVSEPYWSVSETVKNRGGGRFKGSALEAVAELDLKLREAVGCRMISDVPLGAFLSGGVDSSIVVALMQAQSNRPVRTFSIGFEQEGYNEAVHAAAVAEYLGTDHTELYVTESEAQSVIPELGHWYDEPFADSSQIPTMIVSKLAKQEVTVALSGDGGDELFCGYKRYQISADVWRRISRIPIWGRRVVSYFIKTRSSEQWDKVYKVFSRVVPSRFRVRRPGANIRKLGELLSHTTCSKFYRGVVSHWQNSSEDLVIGAQGGDVGILDFENQLPAGGMTFEESMMYIDTVTYLPDDILTKVDRASMAVSLEARVPLLDHRIVDFAWSLPHDFKVREGESKWILKQVLEKYVPRSFFERPKMGFAIPLGEWLKNDLKDWAEEMLDKESMLADGYINPEPVHQLWGQHKEGKVDWSDKLWSVLMFQVWLKKFKE
ncbi:asparagine synthase (glutamine-hydrolyzing), partial [Akkermansiaceae bacterium]|nr:asparagine synthase (glutamine-hydrolyzing) [Akkermansiaceae bacterium]